LKIVPTFQPSYFHRIYAAYGGIFIVMAFLWSLFFEDIVPDIFDSIAAIKACWSGNHLLCTQKKRRKIMVESLAPVVHINILIVTLGLFFEAAQVGRYWHYIMNSL
jgi:hypothetical protein